MQLLGRGRVEGQQLWDADRGKTVLSERREDLRKRELGLRLVFVKEDDRARKQPGNRSFGDLVGAGALGVAAVHVPQHNTHAKLLRFCDDVLVVGAVRRAHQRYRPIGLLGKQALGLGKLFAYMIGGQAGEIGVVPCVVSDGADG